ncbi:MAG: hypothetical protein DHS20C15_16750 [Planctomycetota bacterium]|nr:MAG: hypothetical protein DHS20C15_16750 [Planctomycetota bacterium]
MPRLPLAPLAVLIVGLWALGPALDGGFVYDDHHYISGNPAVVGAELDLTAPLGESIQGLWRPLSVLSWRWQWEGPQTSAWRYHLVDLLLHLGIALAVLGLGRALGLSKLAALIGVLFFAAHPAHVEAVAWVSQRSELLATLFVLLAWRAHLSERRVAPWLLALALTAAALSKENALAAPALFVVGDLALRRRPLPWGRWAVAALVVAGMLTLRWQLLDEPFPAHGPFRDMSLGERLPVALQVFGRALSTLVWPSSLRVEYDRDEFLGSSADALLVVGLFSIALLVAAWRRRQHVATLLALVPVALFPVLQLVPIGEPFAERFLYLPSIPLCLAAGALFALLIRREQASPRGVGLSLLGVVLILALMIPASRHATRAFRSDLALWAVAAAEAPHVPLARYHHGQFLHEARLFAARDTDLPGSQSELRASLELDPDHAYAAFAHQFLARNALGLEGFDLPDLEIAARHARSAHELAPELVEPRLHLADIALRAPSIVARAEATSVLLPLLSGDGLSEEQAQAAGELFLQLSSSAERDEVSTGTSSDEGS